MRARINGRKHPRIKTTNLYLARSAISGKGVFSTTRVRAGAEVITCRGLVLRGNDVRDDMRAMQIGVDLYLAEDPDNPGIDDFVNHSCAPNVGFLDGSLTLYALRHITEEEEIVFDYSTCMNEAGWSIKCRCRTAACRRVIVAFDQLSRQDRKRLDGIALAYLRKPQNSAGRTCADPSQKRHSRRVDY